MKQNKDNNPWAGLSSYEDPATAERKLKFCGRDDDSYDVAKLIMGNTFVTLYGKSGIGKTSLLNAGVFPELREEQYTPFSLRLGIRDVDHPQSYQTIIIEAVKRAVCRIEEIDVIPVQEDQQSVDYLWKYFASHRFYDKDDSPTIPVIVLDQFEEVFRNDREEAEALLRQLDQCVVNSQSRRFDINVRFVVSIREDDLYRLEDSIDNCYLPTLKRCRYRLRSLSEQGAREAVLKPGEGLFKDEEKEEKEEIVSTIINIARNKEDKGISTNLLSLVCSRIFMEFQRSDSEYISSSLVSSFVKDNLFELFYKEATQGFSNREKTYIENHFIDSTGRRNSVPESDFLLNVPNGAVLLEGSRKILQRVSTSSDGSNNRIELIHDSFCEPLAALKEKRLRKKRMVRIAAAFHIIPLFVAIPILLFSLYAQNRKMQNNKARYIANMAYSLVENRDVYGAGALLADILAHNSSHRSVDMERVLRKMWQQDYVVLEKSSSICSSTIAFHPDGQRVAYSSDSTIYIKDSYTGQCLQTMTHSTSDGKSYDVVALSFSNDGKKLVSLNEMGDIMIWNPDERQKLQTISRNGPIVWAAFNADGDSIYCMSMLDRIYVFNVNTGELGNNTCLKGRERNAYTLSLDWTYNNSFFSKDCRYCVQIAQIGEEMTYRLWDTKTGDCLHRLEEYGCGRPVAFSPNSKEIITTAEGTLRLWDVKTWQCVRVFEGHSGIISNAAFSDDGNRIVAISNNKELFIWDASTGQCLKKQHYSYNISDAENILLSPDGNRILLKLENGDVSLLDINKQRCAFTINHNMSKPVKKQMGTKSKKSESVPSHVMLSPDGNTVELFCNSFYCCYNITTGLLTDSFRTAISINKYRCINPTDWRILAFQTLSDNNGIMAVNWRNDSILYTIEGDGDFFESLSYNYDGSKIVSTSSYLSKKGDYLTVKVWDVQKKKAIYVLDKIPWHVKYASLSPDEHYVVTASNDGIVRVWDVETCIVVATYEGHTNGVECVSFSLDGRRIVSASADGTIRIWDFPPLQELIDSTRERFKNRPLTPEERRKYYLE